MVYLKVTTVSLTEHSRVDITICCVHEKHIFKPGPLNLFCDNCEKNLLANFVNKIDPGHKWVVGPSAKEFYPLQRAKYTGGIFLL